MAIHIVRIAVGFSQKTGNFIVAESLRIPLIPAHLLLWVSPAESHSISACLRTRGYRLTVADFAHSDLLLSDVDVVVVDVSAMSMKLLGPVREISASMALCNPHGRILCFSTVPRNSEFVLGLEKCGTRYIRVVDANSLLEAVDLTISDVRSNSIARPSFLIAHRFSNGHCLPGEEIGSVLADNGGRFVQLSLALAQRFVFDFLARNRGIAMDSLQITSGIRGNWFYREHASNSGLRQSVKIRPATIKVLIQRIRNAMARADVRFDPYIVLRAIPVEGSKRAVYRLDADVSWLHRANNASFSTAEIADILSIAKKSAT